jgi:transposase
VTEGAGEPRPELTLAALCERYEQARGLRVSMSAMDRTLKRLKFVRKKKRTFIRSQKTRPSNYGGKRISVNSAIRALKV